MRPQFARPSHATVVAYLALFVALGGTSYAAVTLSKNSVKSKHIKNRQVKKADLAKRSVTGSRVRPGTLRAEHFKPGELPAGAPGPAGPKGDPGPQGPPGPAGAPATTLFAKVASTGELAYGSGGAESQRTAKGFYTVKFGNTDLTGCVASLTPGFGTPAPPGDGGWTRNTSWVVVEADQVSVWTYGYGGSPGSFSFEDQSFHLALFC